MSTPTSIQAIDTGVEQIPFHGELIEAHRADDDLWIVFRPIVEQFGISYSSQLQRLRRAPWASCGHINTTGADGKRYDMVTVNRRTLTMWLATIQENKINEAARPLLALYQSESADVLDSYWHDGGVINPRATVDQLDLIVSRATAQARLIASFKGIIDDKHLEAKARVVLARGLGETPELDPASIPLYVSDYLKSRGLASDMVSAKASGFGKRLKGLYVAEHGEAPGRAYQELPNGTVREVYAYTQADRELFDRIWIGHYEGVTRAAA